MPSTAAATAVAVSKSISKVISPESRLPLVPIRAGFKYRRPGTPKSFTVEVLSALVKSGPLSKYTNGVWDVRCFCGKTFQTSTALIRRFSPGALSCGCRNMRKLRVSGMRVFRPSQRHVNAIYGRLKVIRWRVAEQDWECQCACGAGEYVKPTWRLGIAGGRKCPHVSPHVSESARV